MAEIIVYVKGGYYWRFSDEETAASQLAERSHHVPLHVEPVPSDEAGDEQQDRIRELYFQYGGEKEV